MNKNKKSLAVLLAGVLVLFGCAVAPTKVNIDTGNLLPKDIAASYINEIGLRDGNEGCKYREGQMVLNKGLGGGERVYKPNEVHIGEDQDIVLMVRAYGSMFLWCRMRYNTTQERDKIITALISVGVGYEQ